MEVCFGKNETRHRSEGLTKRGGRKGQDMKKWTGMITNLTMLTQFGLLSLIHISHDIDADDAAV